MKSYPLLCLLLVLILCHISESMAQSGWFWQNPLPQGNRLFGVSFTDANIGTAVGSTGTILRTTDGGATWSSQNSGTTTDLWGVSFTDANTGTVVGFRGTILRTTDGGATWGSQNSGTFVGLTGVSFSEANTGTAVGITGTIVRTTDGGATWISQNSGTNNDLFGVSFTDANTGTAVGDGGTILRTTNGGTVSIQNQYTPQTLDRFELRQNYPNPFNPSTTISYILVQATDITLTIYNILGQRIRTLVNGRQLAGERQVVWDGRDQFGNEVSSGIYIYQLRTREYVQSRKMLLIH